MDNLLQMLTKKPNPTNPTPEAKTPLVPKTPIVPKDPIVAKPKQPPTKTNDNETQICVKLPANLVEHVRDFQHAQALRTGNLHFSFKDAIISIITHHKRKNPEVVPRPEIVKTAEKKTGRKSQK